MEGGEVFLLVLSRGHSMSPVKGGDAAVSATPEILPPPHTHTHYYPYVPEEGRSHELLQTDSPSPGSCQRQQVGSILLAYILFHFPCRVCGYSSCHVSLTAFHCRSFAKERRPRWSSGYKTHLPSKLLADKAFNNTSQQPLFQAICRNLLSIKTSYEDDHLLIEADGDEETSFNKVEDSKWLEKVDDIYYKVIYQLYENSEQPPCRMFELPFQSSSSPHFLEKSNIHFCKLLSLLQIQSYPCEACYLLYIKNVAALKTFNLPVD
ncbi:hypothetical protein PR048_022939 [Dryococelus australis]|uniref:Uncharacterized protein n=1 Tax=Dryococelus australis TaxID=614101 RepID=A0ABQ9GSS1_9NEOP|nr:hypothetical protein PR048_022939 [Dryococelus australis]